MGNDMYYLRYIPLNDSVTSLRVVTVIRGLSELQDVYWLSIEMVVEGYK